MKCAVIGGSVLPPEFDESLREQCELFGENMARACFEILTGACDGYPYMVSIGALKAGGIVEGYSPATNAQEHAEIFEHPLDAVSSMVYLDTYPHDSFMQRMLARSLPLIEACDLVLCIEGSWGTLMELVAAVCMSKPIVIVQEFGGVAAHFEEMYRQIQAESLHPFSSKLYICATLDDAMRQLETCIGSAQGI